ncbi:MAG: UPF0489 family protein [Christensenellales bacterium]
MSRGKNPPSARSSKPSAACPAPRPSPGRIFETHDGALRFWEEQIAAGRLTAPFDVTHVDAHSDLGIGYPGPNFVLFNVLSMPVPKRLDYTAFYAQKKLDEANYLLFALAMRRISSLDNVRNPRSRADIPQVLLDADGNIHLNSLTAQMFAAKNGAEPTVPFRVYDDYRDFRAAGAYDFVTLAISPRYAPKEADGLVEVVGEYIGKNVTSNALQKNGDVTIKIGRKQRSTCYITNEDTGMKNDSDTERA